VLSYIHLTCCLFSKSKYAGRHFASSSGESLQHSTNNTTPAVKTSEELVRSQVLLGGSIGLDSVPLAVSNTLENAIGLLQNISLKPKGIDRILHFKPAHDEHADDLRSDAQTFASSDQAASDERGAPLNAVQIMQTLLDTACFL